MKACILFLLWYISALQCLLDTFQSKKKNLWFTHKRLFCFSVNNSSFILSCDRINRYWILDKAKQNNKTLVQIEYFFLLLEKRPGLVFVFVFYIKIDSLGINVIWLWIFEILTWKCSHKLFLHKAIWSHLKFHLWKQLSVHSERLLKLKPAENNIRRIKANFLLLCLPSLTVLQRGGTLAVTQASVCSDVLYRFLH